MQIFLLLLSPFKYFVLGVYYTIYAIFYPFIIVYDKLSYSAYKSYSDNKRKQDKKEVIQAVNLEITNIDEKIKKNNEEKERETLLAKELNKDNKLNQKNQKLLNQKKLNERDLLIKEINKHEDVRTEYPNTYKYKARSAEGNDVVGYVVAFTKQEVFNFLESEGYLVYKLETNKLIDFFYGQKQFSKKKATPPRKCRF